MVCLENARALNYLNQERKKEKKRKKRRRLTLVVEEEEEEEAYIPERKTLHSKRYFITSVCSFSWLCILVSKSIIANI